MSPEIRTNAAHPAPVSIILIAHNEAATIEREVRAFSRIAQQLPGSEVIVTEDGSRDGTSEILRSLAEELPIKLVQGKERKGYIRAFLDALELPSREWICFCDTGGQFNPDDFWKLERFRDRSDLIIGFKIKRGDQVYRRFLTWGFNLLVRIYFRVPVHDIDSGFRFFRRRIIQEIVSSPLILREMVATELTLRMLAKGARLQEVPVSYSWREGISRGMPPEKIPRVVVHVLRSFPRLRGELARLREEAGRARS